LGAQKGLGEYIAFMDSDCAATPDWLEAGLATFDDGVGIVLGRIMPDPGRERGIFSLYVQVESEGFIYEGANIFYRRRAFEDAGGFAADLTPHASSPMGGEDVDLAWRVKRLGWESRFSEDALVYHDVHQASVVEWIVIKRLFIWPGLVGKFPELRTHMSWRYFYDRNQAWFLIGLVGTALAFWTWFGLALWIPYWVSRCSEPSATLKGLFRLLRPLFYLTRDATSFIILTAGSIRFRALLL
jgi:hypothetical protein